ILALTTLPGRPAAADLIRPNASPSYPDIASDVNGVQNFTFHPETQTGVFTVTNTPYLLVGGPSVADEFAILPNSDGVRRQAVSLTLDSSGKLLDDPGNSYELYGTIVTKGQTYSGLLLKGVPTNFGAQDLGPVGIQGTDVYDLDLKITGGALAANF